VQACAELAEALLRACPQRRVLATSRELLGAAGETTWRVPSLSVPGATGMRSVDDTARSEAVRLFIERAQAVRPELALTEWTARVVTSVDLGIAIACALMSISALRVGLTSSSSRLLAEAVSR
jgi:non-specific serine/threonine protein kinase